LILKTTGAPLPLYSRIKIDVWVVGVLTKKQDLMASCPYYYHCDTEQDIMSGRDVTLS